MLGNDVCFPIWIFEYIFFVNLLPYHAFKRIKARFLSFVGQIQPKIASIFVAQAWRISWKLLKNRRRPLKVLTLILRDWNFLRQISRYGILRTYLLLTIKDFLLTIVLIYWEIIIWKCQKNIWLGQVYFYFSCLIFISSLFFSDSFLSFKFYCFSGDQNLIHVPQIYFKRVNLVSIAITSTENNQSFSTENVASTFENDIGSTEVSWEKVWCNYGLFDARKNDYSMEKVNFSENALIFLNKSYLTVKKNNKMFCCDYFMFGWIIEASTTPQDMSTYDLKENEVKMVRPRYNNETEEFLGLYETVGYVIVRGLPKEAFFSYGFDKEMSKILYLHYRRRIPNSFCGTIFNRRKMLAESCEVDAERSNIYFFALHHRQGRRHKPRPKKCQHFSYWH